MKKTIKPIVSIILLILLCVAAHPLSSSNAQIEKRIARLAVIVASSEELVVLHQKMNIENTILLNNKKFYLGRLSGSSIVLFASGKSMINAAIFTQFAVDHFDIKGIIVSGIAGGCNPSLNIGDVVVPAQWINYSEMLLARKIFFGIYDLGKHSVPNYEDGKVHFSMCYPRAVQVETTEGVINIFWFKADKNYLSIAKSLSENVELKRTNEQEKSFSYQPKIVIGGNGASGSTFVENSAYSRWLWKAYKADVVDMETAAIAQCAYTNNKPFIAFRSLSDLAGKETNPEVRLSFKGLAAENSANVVIAFLKALNASGLAPK